MVKKNKINSFKKKTIYQKWNIFKIINTNCEFIRTISFNYFQEIFATGASDNIVYLYSLKSFKNLAKFFGHKRAIKTVLFDEKQNSIFSAGDDFIIKHWDIESNKNIRNYNGHINSVEKLIKHPNLNLIFSSSKDNTIRIWDFRIQKEVTILYGHNDSVTCLLSFSENPHIISGSLDKTIRFWDLVANKNTLIIKNSQNHIKEMLYIEKYGEFSTLSSDSINFYRKDGLLSNKIVNLKKSYISFTAGKKDMAIGYSTGWIKYLCFNRSSFFFKLFDEKFIKKKTILNISIILNQLEKQLFVIGFQNKIKIFSKQWFFFNINENRDNNY